jgi:hypothetical protein
MTIREYLVQARKDDARRAGEQDRLLLEARRASAMRRLRSNPAVVPVKRLVRLVLRRSAA